MDISTMYMLLIVAAILFLISLVAFMTENENIVTLTCMLISTTVMWKLGNAYIDGTLTKLVGDTGVTEVVREATAASIFHWLAIIMFVGFVLQVIGVFKRNQIIEDW